MDQETENTRDNIIDSSQSVEHNTIVKANNRRHKRSKINIRYSSNCRSRDHTTGMDDMGANERITDLDGLCQSIVSEFRWESD